MENILDSINVTNIQELSHDEIQDINGGFLPLLLAGIGIYGGICALAYGAGALYGLITEE